MANNISVFSLKSCYGCTACAAVCPHNAIQILPNDEGFYYPHLDKDKCIDCGVCLKVCNINEQNLIKVTNDEPQSVYAAWSKDRASVLKSTSGGVSFHISKNFIRNGGVVYGVGWKEHLKASHIRVDKIEQLESLRGSKYVQSDLDGVYLNIKCDLKEGRKVLFIGTPCQVGGLKSFLNKEQQKNLYTIDLVCHGTPSNKMFQAYLSYLENKEKSKIISFAFRGKKTTGWRAYEIVKYDNGKETIKTSGHQPYFVGFYDDLFSKEKCYGCGYSQKRRPGDVTLSDFWGSEKSNTLLAKERKYGYNFFSCNTYKGAELFEMVKNEIVLIPSSYDIAVAGDIRFRSSNSRPIIRNFIYKELDTIGFDGIKKKYLDSTKQRIKRLVPEKIINLIREIQCRIK